MRAKDSFSGKLASPRELQESSDAFSMCTWWLILQFWLDHIGSDFLAF